MLFLFVVIPEGCERGITFSETGPKFIGIVNKSEYAGVIRDIIFSFSFCPEETGIYDILYNGSIDAVNEGAWSSYSFNGTVQKSREFKNLELNEGTCYPVSIGHSSNCGYAWGVLRFTHNGITRVFSLNDSFSCPIGWCKNGGEFPQCLPPPTVEFTEQDTRLNNLFLLLFGLLLLQ